MGLRTMRCDRCGELEMALFRAGPIGQDKVEWYCELCMRESGQGWELDEIVQILKRLNDEKQ